MNAYLDKTDAFMASLGMETYRVGGSVRDEVLGRRVKDADYMVRGYTLDQIGRVLRDRERLCDIKVSPLKLRDGRQAGWRVSGRGLGCIEIVLPRKEVSTGPGHRDFKIVVDPNLSIEEDAQRRDFTFNALYIPLNAENYKYGDGVNGRAVIDPLNGVEDLRRRRIQVTHADSFRDDPLRTLRALRFVSTLDYELAPETRALMALHAEHVNGLTSNGYASGTVYTEMSKLLMGDNVQEALRNARDTGVLGTLFVELADMLGFDQRSRYHDLTTDEHTFKTLDTAAHVDAPLAVRWALLFHDSGKPESAWTGKDGRLHYYANPELGKEDHQDIGADNWMDAAEWMNVPRDMRGLVDFLCRNHMVACTKFNRAKVRRARVKHGDERMHLLYLMRMCDLSGKGKANLAQLEIVRQMEAERKFCEESKVPATNSDLKINGHDVIALGARGTQIGEVLGKVLDEVALDPTLTKDSRAWQLERAATVLS